MGGFEVVLITGVNNMATPSQILRKTKQPEKKGDADKDDKDKPAGRRNALIDFIAKKKAAAK